MVTRLDKSILYLGYDWLVGANPKIDWRMSCIARITMDQTHNCLTEKVDQRTSQIGRIAPDQTPDYLTEFMDIFSDTRVKRLPPHQVWDHCINLTLDWAQRGKVYSMC